MSANGILEQIENLVDEVNQIEALDGIINIDISKELLLAILKASETHFNRLE